MKITIFTASMINNDYLLRPEVKFCIKSFDNLKEALLKQGHQCEIKIFNYNSPEVIQFNNEVVTSLKKLPCRNAFYADIFRIWYLSKHENSLWLDADVWINPFTINSDLNWLLNSNYLFRRGWYILYNRKNCNLFKEILKGYIEGKYINTSDSQITEQFYISNINKLPRNFSFVHISNFLNSRPQYINILKRIEFLNTLSQHDIDFEKSNINEPLFIITMNSTFLEINPIIKSKHGIRIIHINSETDKEFINYIINKIKINKNFNLNIRYCNQYLTCDEVINNLTEIVLENKTEF